MLKRIVSAVVIVAAPLIGGAGPQSASMPAWSVPNPDTLPNDAFGRTVREGRDLIVKTSSLIGPDAADPAKRYAGNGLDCQSCHLQAGTQRFGLPLAGVWGVFPVYMARENEVRTLEERINGCMERSMNGKPLPVDSPEMTAMLSYIKFISASERYRPVPRWPGHAGAAATRNSGRSKARTTGLRRDMRRLPRPERPGTAPGAGGGQAGRASICLPAVVGAGQLQRRRRDGARDHRGPVRPCKHAVWHDIRGACAVCCGRVRRGRVYRRPASPAYGQPGGRLSRPHAQAGGCTLSTLCRSIFGGPAPFGSMAADPGLD